MFEPLLTAVNHVVDLPVTVSFFHHFSVPIDILLFIFLNQSPQITFLLECVNNGFLFKSENFKKILQILLTS